MLPRRATAALALAALVLAGPKHLSSEEPKERLLIDASALGAPISPWVYGQFIEPRTLDLELRGARDDARRRAHDVRHVATFRIPLRPRGERGDELVKTLKGRAFRHSRQKLVTGVART